MGIALLMQVVRALTHVPAILEQAISSASAENPLSWLCIVFPRVIVKYLVGGFLLTIHIRRGHLKTLRSEAEQMVQVMPNKLVRTSVVSMLSGDSKTRRRHSNSSSSPTMKCLLAENHQKKAAQKRLSAQYQRVSMLAAAPSNAWKMPPSTVRTDFTTAHKSKRLKVQDPPLSMMSPSERMTYHAPWTDVTTGTAKKKKKLKQTKHS